MWASGWVSFTRALPPKVGQFWTRANMPLQMGGWQDVTCTELIEWMLRGWKPKKSLAMEI